MTYLRAVQSGDELDKAVIAGADPLLPELSFTDEFWQNCLALRPKLAAYLRAMLPDHHAVDDCIQDTLVVLAQRYTDATGGDLSALAFTCARNHAHNWLARNRVGRLSIIDPEVLATIAEAAAQSSDEDGDHLTRIGALRACLARLPSDQRQLIEARYGDDRNASVAALADGTGRKCDALYKKLERLRAALKRCVTERLATPP